MRQPSIKQQSAGPINVFNNEQGSVTSILSESNRSENQDDILFLISRNGN